MTLLADHAIFFHAVSPSHKTEAFFSQDPSKYFWWPICLSPGSTSGTCSDGFFDLVIKDTRTSK
ncbi:hypothetical protein DPMN_092518 [Dreissena polymorpha]|uniref:Uncharacterized protein n=1 Tax=Dreissena polymorpha TaxID=45954 RepID=A0A9D4R127_DREPO|nr:hypothetical protein DPMN_092518 [Dreissena polymorpha]